MDVTRNIYAFALAFLCSWSAAMAQYPNNIPVCGLTPVNGDKTAAQQEPQLFKGKFFYQQGNPPLKENHSWLLYLEDAEGKVLEGAAVQGDGINYDAGRGFAKPPVIIEYAGTGHYKVDGVYFSVGGIWTMRFQVICEGKAEVLSFEVEI